MRSRRWIVAVLCGAAALWSGPPAGAVDLVLTRPALRVGLRRSAYGLRARKNDDDWWIQRACQYAASFPGAEPLIVEVVSTYQGEATQFGFAQPNRNSNPAAHICYSCINARNYDATLTAYDRAGVRTILQLEPGNADVVQCLQLVQAHLGRHPCIVGYGIDAEWYRRAQYPAQFGKPVSDEEARCWTERVRSFNPEYTFFIKHWMPSHLPPHYRSPNLWFLNDSQRAGSAAALLREFRLWDAAAGGAATGFQIGYPSDRSWWQLLPHPPATLGQAVVRASPSCQYLLWVDFSAAQVAFAPPLDEQAAAAEPARDAPPACRLVRKGEIGIGGEVPSVEAGRSFLLRADRCRLSTGAIVAIRPARKKRVLLMPGTEFMRGAAADLKPGRRVDVIGLAGQVGRPIAANWIGSE